MGIKVFYCKEFKAWLSFRACEERRNKSHPGDPDMDPYKTCKKCKSWKEWQTENVREISELNKYSEQKTCLECGIIIPNKNKTGLCEKCFKIKYKQYKQKDVKKQITENKANDLQSKNEPNINYIDALNNVLEKAKLWDKYGKDAQKWQYAKPLIIQAFTILKGLLEDVDGKE